MRYTEEEIAARFDEAARVLRRLPADRPREFGSLMPTPLRDPVDEFAKAVVAGRYELPGSIFEPLTRDDVRRLGEVLAWFFFFPRPHAIREWRAIWAVACHVRMKNVTCRLRCSRQHVYRLRERGFRRLAARLAEA